MYCLGRLKGRAHSTKTSLWTRMGEAREGGGREDGGAVPYGVPELKSQGGSGL